MRGLQLRTNNASITDVVIGCGVKGGLEMKQPFNASWLKTCTVASATIRASGLRAWISLEPSDDSNMAENRAFWAHPPIDAMRTVSAQVNVTGWNFDWECNGTPDDQDKYIDFLAIARSAVGPIIVDANDNGCVSDYPRLANASDYVMDMSLYYETWPDDWTKEVFYCKNNAGVKCMAGMADYKAWPETEVRDKVALLVANGVSTTGVFTLASQFYPKRDPGG
jgi:hypothetical protein